jgi:hypothetical protein
VFHTTTISQMFINLTRHSVSPLKLRFIECWRYAAMLWHPAEAILIYLLGTFFTTYLATCALTWTGSTVHSGTFVALALQTLGTASYLYRHDGNEKRGEQIQASSNGHHIVQLRSGRHCRSGFDQFGQCRLVNTTLVQDVAQYRSQN